jgi:hypothetical protein
MRVQCGCHRPTTFPEVTIASVRHFEHPGIIPVVIPECSLRNARMVISWAVLAIMRANPPNLWAKISLSETCLRRLQLPLGVNKVPASLA